MKEICLDDRQAQVVHNDCFLFAHINQHNIFYEKTRNNPLRTIRVDKRDVVFKSSFTKKMSYTQVYQQIVDNINFGAAKHV